MRQYERQDCNAFVRKDQELEVAYVQASIYATGSCDMVLIFGNPKTREVVWIPYSSRVQIEGEEFKVLRGESFHGRRGPDTPSQSVECLLDEDGNLHSMYDFMNQKATVIEVCSSKSEAIRQLLFDRKHGKLEPGKNLVDLLRNYAVIGSGI